jgi:hypothetical protein
MAVRSLLLIFGLLALWRCFFGERFRSLHLTTSHGEPTITTISGGTIPNEPTALVVTYPNEHSRWTISIPHNTSFPLPDRHHINMCSQSVQLRAEMEKPSHTKHTRSWWRRNGYNVPDPTYLDILEAEQAGLLPESHPSSNVCARSLTYVLGPNDASFGTSLLHLWLAYGLAKKEGRAFFLDDSHWAWGKFGAYFIPPAAPTCGKPPPQHIVPCPHSARHIVITSGTAQFAFGDEFKAAYTPPRRPHFRHRSLSSSSDPIFDLMRDGYSALFHLTGEDSLYASSRIAALQSDAEGGALIGVQVRRGDLHPFEAQYSRDYLPLSRYISAAEEMCSSLDPPSPGDKKLNERKCTLALSSDDPSLLIHATSSGDHRISDISPGTTLQRAQNRIHLATKAALDASSPVHPLRTPGSAFAKHLPENSGWEGGFYPGLFFSIGANPSTARSSATDDWPVVDAQAMALRQMVGRAYVLDLAVLGSASDGVVCGVGSATCRVLGVMMMGSDDGEDGRWRNVDLGRKGWSWDGR